ncbi:NAD(P)H-dependent oxidoreductase [Sphingomonas lenta]|uniref:NAD(P)-dependent oxidoreductase n=1 Tax=Sphingomonas lenta TaxID=1141887 RepID=A0A2A2SAX9_9SPHN|nr:SAF domain-containing protein [Sphingomonas lenta]PAX06408.1 NAD(P)-dependent oxidoreductase [Sphingomonas lenta]
MILVDTALRHREVEGRPIRVGLVGPGTQGAAIVRQVVTATRGMRIAGIANRHIERAVRAFADVGIEPVLRAGRTRIEEALGAGLAVATEDAIGLAQADGVDVVVEVTGSFDHAARVVLAAIEAGKHVVHMNAELDGTVGPILKAKADAAGVIYSFSDGDQPGVEMNLYRFVVGLGVKPVLCGNMKGLHDPYRTPATQQAFAAKWDQNPAMAASFADGTKISFEQAIVANGTGFRVARRGMLGPDFSGGDPYAPLVPLEETVSAFADTLDASEHGLVDYVVGARPGGGVFVLGTHDDPRQQHFLRYYKMGDGPYYCFYTPYHLCHLEVPTSIARAALFGDAVLTPLAGPQVGVIAVAKTDLAPGTVIDQLGGFEAYGVAENSDRIDADDLLPLGLALGSTVTRPVRRDQALVFADVRIPEGRIIDRLYAEQRARFGRPIPAG